MSNGLTALTLITTSQFDLIDQEIRNDPRLKSGHTRRGYKADLVTFENWRAERPMTRRLVEQYAAELLEADKAPTSINRALAAIRWWARRVAGMAQETPARTAKEQRKRAEFVSQAERVASVEDVKPGERLPPGRHIAPGELAALMQICENDPTPAGARDAALIALAWAIGARRDELGGLTLDDLNPTGEGEADLVIRGKGDKQRVAYVFNGAHDALMDWLTVRGPEPGPLFCVIGKGGKLFNRRLSGEALRLVLDKRIEDAKLKPLTWHDFRRSFAGNLLNNGQDLVTVQKLMGHSDPRTTGNYDRRPDTVRREAVKTLFVPYRGRLV